MVYYKKRHELNGVNNLQVQCVICDIVEHLEDNSLEAKRLRNRLSHMYLCENCYERIKVNTLNKRKHNYNDDEQK